MIKNLFIAEKPAAGADIANALAVMHGVQLVKNRSHIVVGDNVITWLRGHFYEMYSPKEYSPHMGVWRSSNYPFVPETWRRKLRSGDDYIKMQASAVRHLIQKAETIVCAGDAGREGQLLVDELLIENGVNPFGPNVYRIWMKAMTQKAIIKAIEDKMPNKAKANLFESALMRQKADWLLGMNLTGVYTSILNESGANGILPVGRVRTPTLKLVVDRDRAIENFKPTKHFLPTVTFRHAAGLFKANWVIPKEHPALNAEGYMVDRGAVEAVVDKVRGKSGVISASEKTLKSKAPPLTHSMTTLIKACTNSFGFTAEKTSQVMQALYDKKLISYPRSEVQHLPLALLTDEAPTILKALSECGQFQNAAQGADLKIKTKVWNDEKIGDHYGVVPTIEFSAAKYAGCTPDEQNVLGVVAKAFIANFYPDQKWYALTAHVGIEGETFKANGTQPVSSGWRKVYEGSGDEVDADEALEDGGQAIPVMERGSPVKAEGAIINDKETRPPQRFNDATLIELMANVDRVIPAGDIEIRKRLKDTAGIGTVATRAGILKSLFAGGFVARPNVKGRKKESVEIISTKVGREQIDALPPALTSPALTALWEAQLKGIEDGAVRPEEFYGTLVRSVQKHVDVAKSRPLVITGMEIVTLDGHGEKCEKCHTGVMRTRTIPSGQHKGKRYLSCDGYRKDDPTSCRHAIFGDGKKIDGHGRKCPKCAKGTLITRQAKNGSYFLTCDVWVKDRPDQSCDYREFQKEVIPPMSGHGGTCAKCGVGKMVTKKFFTGEQAGSLYLACDGYRKDDPKSCRNAIYPEPKKRSAGSATKPVKQARAARAPRAASARGTGRRA